MTTDPLDFSPWTLARLRQLAESRHCTPNELLVSLMQPLEASPSTPDALLGLMADEPELVDQMLAFAHEAREQHPWRAAGDGPGATRH